MTWTQENTDGYTDAELDSLNTEWDAIVQAKGLESDADEWYARESQFQDEVSRHVQQDQRKARAR